MTRRITGREVWPAAPRRLDDHGKLVFAQLRGSLHHDDERLDSGARLGDRPG